MAQDRPSGNRPRPSTRITIWMGGYSAAALRRSARLTDGHIYGPGGGTQVSSLIPKLTQFLQEAGRDPDAFGHDVILPLSESEEEWRQDAAQMRAAEVTKLSVVRAKDGSPLDDYVEFLSRVGDVLKE